MMMDVDLLTGMQWGNVSSDVTTTSPAWCPVALVGHGNTWQMGQFNGTNVTDEQFAMIVVA